MTDQQAAERLARIESNIERIALLLEKTSHDHEMRIRELERQVERTTGVLRLIGWLGAPMTAAIVLFMAKAH